MKRLEAHVIGVEKPTGNAGKDAETSNEAQNDKWPLPVPASQDENENEGPACRCESLLIIEFRQNGNPLATLPLEGAGAGKAGEELPGVPAVKFKSVGCQDGFAAFSECFLAKCEVVEVLGGGVGCDQGENLLPCFCRILIKCLAGVGLEDQEEGD